MKVIWLRQISLLILVVAAGLSLGKSPAQQRDRSEEDSRSALSAGRRVFTSACAGCHGLDGRGGKTAPNIANNAKLQRMRDSELAAIVSNGIAGTGMPAFHSLSTVQVQAVIRYLRFLQGQGTAQKLPGYPARGKAIFFGKGSCSTCHMMRGEGGFMGPDLSTFGSGRSVQEVMDAITNPRETAQAAYKAVVVVTSDGQRISGVLKNEDNFSLQLETSDGSFHFFPRSEVKNVEYQEHSMMPTDYKERLDHAELDDLAAYLISAARTAKSSSVGERD